MACAVSIEISQLQAFKMPWQQMLEEKYNLTTKKIGWHCSMRKTKSHLNQISWIAGFKGLWVHNMPLESCWRNWWIQHGSIDRYNGAVERSVWYNWIQSDTIGWEEKASESIPFLHWSDQFRAAWISSRRARWRLPEVGAQIEDCSREIIHRAWTNGIMVNINLLYIIKYHLDKTGNCSLTWFDAKRGCVRQYFASHWVL